MSWQIIETGETVTEEEFLSNCDNCAAFYAEGNLSVPCNGERCNCVFFKEIDD